MNLKGKLAYLVPALLLFLIVYMLVAARPVAAELHFQPLWTINISEHSSTAPIPPAEEAEAFILGSRYGWFTPDGHLGLSETMDFRAAISNHFYAVYNQTASDIPVFSLDGSPAFTITGSGFPHIDEDRVYLFLPGGNGVSRIGSDGTALWTYEHTAPITAFDSSPGGTVIGYADGRLVCLDSTGVERMHFYPGGSDLQVILGLAVSGDGNTIACVSGIDKQRFLIMQYTGSHYKVQHHIWLEGNLHRQAFVDFEADGRYIFFEHSGGLGIVDSQRYISSFIPYDGAIVSAGTSPADGLFLVLGKKGTDCTLMAIERPNNTLATARFTARDAFLIQRGSAVYLGTDTHLSRIDIRGLK